MRAVIERLPFFAPLRPQEQEALCAKAARIAAGKSWEGCGGVEITDAMRASIAAQAALLVLHREVQLWTPESRE